jgi:hypothetical protein
MQVCTLSPFGRDVRECDNDGANDSRTAPGPSHVQVGSFLRQGFERSRDDLLELNGSICIAPL